MPTFFEKALARGINVGNCVSYCAQKMLLFGTFSSTLLFYMKAKLLGVHVGRNVRVHGHVILMRAPGGTITIDDNVRIIATSRRATASSVFAPTRLRVFGDGAIHLGKGCELTATSITSRSKPISIGNDVLIAPNCVLMDSDFHQPWPCHERKYAPGYANDAPITIEDCVWIGMQSIILKGVTIGYGSIIGAGSVVTHSIPPYSLAAGNPAKVL